MIQTNLLTSLLGQEAPIIPCMQREPLPHMVWYKQRLFLETMCVCACVPSRDLHDSVSCDHIFCLSFFHRISHHPMPVSQTDLHKLIFTQIQPFGKAPSKRAKGVMKVGRGGWLGKALEPGFELGMPLAQQRNNWHISQKDIGAEGMQILITTVSQS